MKSWTPIIITIGLVVIGWFWPVWVKGRVPIAIDIPVGMYYPWLNYHYGYPVRPPVRNPILTDTVSQFWIWRNWAVDGLKHGKIKLWNPHSFSGYPVSPWFHTLVLSPLNIFYFLGDDLSAMTLIVIAQIVVSLVATYWLGINLFRSKISALFFAVCWSTSTYFTGWLTWGSISFALALLPLGMLFLTKLSQNVAWKHSLGLELAFLSLVFSGHLQTIGYVLFIWVLWALIESQSSQNKKQFFSTLVFITALSVTVSAVAWLPSLNIVSQSIRSYDRQISETSHVFAHPARVLAKLLSPNFFGNPGTNNYWANGGNFQEELVGFGSSSFALFIGYLLTHLFKKKRHHETLALWSILVGLALSFRFPFGFIIYWLKIPLISTSPAGRALILVIFGGSILASQLFDSVVNHEINRHHYLRLAVNILGVIIGAILGILFWLSFSGSQFQFDSHALIIIRNLAVSFAFIFATLVFIGISLTSRRFASFSGIAIVILLLADNYLFFIKYTPFVDRRLYFPTTKTLDFLEHQTGDDFFRVERETGEILPPNMWQLYGLYSTSGYDPINPKKYSDYLTSRHVGPGYSRYVENGSPGLDRIANDLAVKYFLVLKRLSGGKIDESGQIPSWIDTNRWSQIESEGPVVVLENIQFAGVVSWSNHHRRGLKLLNHQDDEWLIETNLDQPDKLTLAENNSPGWRVSIDGTDAHLVADEITLKAVVVPPGHHLVRFYYHNQDWSLALKISLLGSILTLSFLWRSIANSRYLEPLVP